MIQNLRPARYLNRLRNSLDIVKPKKFLQVNPTLPATRKEPDQIKIFVYDFSARDVKEHEVTDLTQCFGFLDSPKVSWINIDGLRKKDVEEIANHLAYIRL